MDFEESSPIIIRPFTSDWGPFGFNLAGGIPIGATPQSVVARSEMKNTNIDTTEHLIEEDSAVIVPGTTIVQVKFKWPGTEYVGKHDLLLDVTFSSGAKHTYVFSYILVKEDSAS